MCDSLRGHRHSRQSKLHGMLKSDTKRSAQKTRPILKSSAPTLTSVFTLVLQYMRLCVRRVFLKKRPSGIFANTSSALPPSEFLCSNGPLKRLALRASFLVSLNQVSRKAAHQAQDLPLNIQIVMVTKLASIL